MILHLPDPRPILSYRDRASDGKLFKLLLGIVLLATPASATKLTFEGLLNNTTLDVAYAEFGIEIKGGIAIIDSDSGGTGDFGGEPSPSTTAYAPFELIVNIPKGILGDIRFYYANPWGTTTIRAYSNSGGRGTVLMEANLSPTSYQGGPDPTGQFSPFIPIAVPFNGVAHSFIISSRAPGGMYLDDVTVEQAQSTVPEPSSIQLWMIGAAVLVQRLKQSATGILPMDR